MAGKGGSLGASHTAAVIFVVVLLAVAVILALAFGLGQQPSDSDSDSKPTTPYPGADAKCRTHIPHTSAPRLNTTIECPKSDQPPNCPAGLEKPVLIMLSVDGFDAEYLRRNLTPTIEALRSCGVRAPYMRSVFPSVTFANQITIATGLYPESHGIIANSFFDPEFGEMFKYGGRNLSDNRWYSGEPIWNSAKKAGKKVATLMFTGSDLNIQGMRPDICYNYNKSVSSDDRVAEVLTWFDGSPKDFPNFGGLYFDILDTAGHRFGPYHRMINETLMDIDSLVATLVEGLKQRLNNCFNFIILSDHGMSAVEVPQNVIDLSKYIDVSKYTVYTLELSRLSSGYLVNSNTNVTVVDKPVPVSETLQQLSCQSYNNSKDFYARAMTKQDLPKRYHYINNRRIEDIVFDIADEYIIVKNMAELAKYPPGVYGVHGHDPTYESMHGIFIACGPAFKNIGIDGFENIEVYNMLAEVLEVPAAPNNGTKGSLHHILVKPPSLQPSMKRESTKSGTLSCRYPATTEDRERKLDGTDCSCSDWTMISNGSIEAADSRLDVSATNVNETLQRHLPWGLPTGKTATCLLTQEDYLIGYSDEFHMPLWAAFTVKPGKVSLWDSGKLRSDKVYEGCSRIDVRLNATTPCSDYSSSSDSRTISPSFLFPPGLSSSESSLTDAYISSNMAPMFNKFRSGVWRDALWLMEEYAEKYGLVKVVSGPIFDYNSDGLADSFSEVTRFVGSNGQVPIPTHYFLIFTYCNVGADCDKSTKVMSFIVPHRPAVTTQCWASLTSLSKLGENYLRFHTARVRDVELLTGFSLFNGMTPLNRIKLVTFQSETLWPRPSWRDLGKTTATQCPPLNSSSASCPASYAGRPPPLILISLDGFRPDYFNRGLTPTIKKLADCGVNAPYMKSVYPTFGFVNAYTIVTGLYPESNGIIDNTMYDIELNKSFSLTSRAALDSDWYSGEPIWNTLVKNNRSAMTYFWPGSVVEIGGQRPTKYVLRNSAHSHPYSLRVDTALKWLNGSVNGTFPSLVTLYFSEVDKAGHDWGHQSLQVNKALESMDKAVAELMDGLYRLRLHACANIIIVSNHGMSEKSCDHTVLVSDHLSSDEISRLHVHAGPAARISNKYYKINNTFHRVDSKDQVPVSNITQSLNCKSPHMVAYDKRTLPRRLHYSSNHRIDDVLLLMDDTWQADRLKPSCSVAGGQHGWDPRYDSMKALFLAYGPDFAQNKKVEPFENIELYNLMAHLTGVSGAPNNGTKGSLCDLLASPPQHMSRPDGSYYATGQYPASDDQNATVATIIACDCELSDEQMQSLNKRLNMSTSKQSSLLYHVAHGLPVYNSSQPAYLLHHTHFVSAYSEELKQPMWSAAKMSANQVLPVSQLTNCSRADVRLTAKQPTCDDFISNAEISRAYLFPPQWSDDTNASSEAQLLTNVVPMSTGFKNAVWDKTLEYIKSLPSKFRNDQLYVVFGPVFDYDADGLADTNLTAARAAGGGDIPVPSHIFVILLKCSSGSCDQQQYDSLAFILPQIYPASECLTADQVMNLNVARIRDVELLTGLGFLRNQPSTQAAARMRVAVKDIMW